MTISTPIVVTFLLGCAAGTHMIRPAAAQSESTPGAPAYEFDVLECPDAQARVDAGRAGWRLVSVAPLISNGTTTCASWFFERPAS